VTSYTIAAGNDFTAPQTPLYDETYGRPLTVRGAPTIPKVLAAADRYAEQGIDFEGNGFANAYANCITPTACSPATPTAMATPTSPLPSPGRHWPSPTSSFEPAGAHHAHCHNH
jgi:hypothetical protein